MIVPSMLNVEDGGNSDASEALAQALQEKVFTLSAHNFVWSCICFSPLLIAFLPIIVFVLQIFGDFSFYV